jgi:hypothetical protein
LGYVSISLAYVSISLAYLANWEVFAWAKIPSPSSWMGSAGVQQSLSHTTDSQLDWGLGFD